MTRFVSSTHAIPESAEMPRHVAVIMDGNGRWARRRFLPRVAGHKRGVDTVRAMVRACIERDIPYLTLFAFSSENWRRPQEEVSFLMQLFVRALEDEVAKLHENRICFRVIGDLSRFDAPLVELIRRAEHLTRHNERLTLTVAANYGGRWDILQATERMLAAQPERRHGFSENDLQPHLSLSYAPEPDLFIRTGGEKRISNFLLWQLAYTELYFTDLLWPEFDAAALDEAIASYRKRERRFGRTSEQLKDAQEPRRRADMDSDAAPSSSDQHA
jgi:undecaprenyl diphosphate synthase